MGLIQDIHAEFDKLLAGVKARGIGTDVSDLVDQGKAQVTQLLTEAGHDVEADAQTAEADVHDATAPAADAASTPAPDVPAAQ